MSMQNIQGFMFLAIAIIYVLVGMPIIGIIPAALGVLCFIVAAYKEKIKK